MLPPSVKEKERAEEGKKRTSRETVNQPSHFRVYPLE
jgi:hypothetical protein